MNRRDIALLAKLAAITLAILVTVQGLALLYCVTWAQRGFAITESNSLTMFDAKAKKCDGLQQALNNTLIKALDLGAGFLAGKMLK